MKIEELKKSKPKGALLDSFNPGDCVRLICSGSKPRLGAVYIVSSVGRELRTAINLSDGDYRSAGRFVLEPTAKVVLE